MHACACVCVCVSVHVCVERRPCVLESPLLTTSFCWQWRCTPQWCIHRWFRAGKFKFVFLVRSPLYLVMISKTNEAVRHVSLFCSAALVCLCCFVGLGWIGWSIQEDLALTSQKWPRGTLPSLSLSLTHTHTHTLTHTHTHTHTLSLFLCIAQLRQQLVYVYNQLLSILTHSHIKRAFERWSNYDLRRHLAGMEKFTEHLIDRLDSSVAR